MRITDDGNGIDVERIRETIASHHNASCGQLADALLQSAKQFMGGLAQRDDVTVLVLGYET